MKYSWNLIALLMALTASAQDPPHFGETMEVRLINVDVVVRDSDGRVVRGLTAEDFAVRENGVSQPITNFAEYRSDEAPLEPAGIAVEPIAARSDRRYLLLFVDRLNLRETVAREEFFRGLRAFVERTMRQGDEAAVFYWGTSLKVLTPMTPDRAAVMAAVSRLQKESALQIDRTEMEIAELNMRRQMLTQEVDAGTARESMKEDRRKAAQRAFDYQQRKITAINYAIQTCAGLDGRKVMVLVTDRLSNAPGLEYGYGELGAVYQDPSDDRSFGREFNGEFNARRQLDSVVRNANSAGVTVYGFFPKGLAADQPAAAAMEPQRNTSYAMLHDHARALESIAGPTGGTIAVGGRLAAEALADAADQLDNYYSLAYRPSDLRTDRTRRISVTVNRPGLTVQTRDSVVDRSDEDVLRDRVVARLLYGSSKSDSTIRIRVKQRDLKATGRGRVVASVDIIIPVAQLTTIPGRDGYEGKFRVLTAAANADGDISDVVEKVQAFQIPEADLKRARAKMFTYHLQIEVRATSNRIIVAVVDDLDKDTGYAHLPIDAKQRARQPEMPPPGRSGRSPWVRQ